MAKRTRKFFFVVLWERPINQAIIGKAAQKKLHKMRRFLERIKTFFVNFSLKFQIHWILYFYNIFLQLKEIDRRTKNSCRIVQKNQFAFIVHIYGENASNADFKGKFFYNIYWSWFSSPDFCVIVYCKKIKVKITAKNIFSII